MRIGLRTVLTTAVLLGVGSYGLFCSAATPQGRKPATAARTTAVKKPVGKAVVKKGGTPAGAKATKPAGQTSHAAVVAVPEGAQNIHGLNWYSVSSGLAAARKQNKPIVIDFYTDWCGWCKVMEEKTFQNSTVKPVMAKRFILIRANSEDSGDGQKLSAALGVTGLPTTVIMDATGKPRDFKRGFVPPEKFLPFLEGYLAGKPVGDAFPQQQDGPGSGAPENGATAGSGTPNNPRGE